MITSPQHLFGTDLRLGESPTGLDLSMEGPTAHSGDIAIASGHDNIIQALSLRLRVRKGELASIGWPTYGSRLHELIGEPDLPRTRLRAQVFAREAVESDPRVAHVETLQVESHPNIRGCLRLSMSVRLIQEPTPLNLVFDVALEGA